MDEYIKRQKLYNNLVLLAKYETGERQQGILGCTETVRIFPAADVVPVVHGQWLRSDDDWGSLTSIRCSITGQPASATEAVKLASVYCTMTMEMNRMATLDKLEVCG